MAEPVFIDRTTERPTLLGTWRAVFTYRSLLRNLVARDLKLKYRGSTLGFLWSLINPLVMLVVYTVAFSKFMGRGGPDYVFLLLVALLAWTFFATSVAGASGSLVDNASLTKSLHFPRAILPLSTVLFNLAQLLLTAAVFIPILMAYHHITPRWVIVLFPVLLAVQFVFVAGVALILASLTAMFRDVKHLVEVGLGILFWMTPIVYTVQDLQTEWVRPIIAFTPVAPFIRGYQAIFIHQIVPGVDIWVTSVAFAAVALALGARLFGHVEPRLGEML